jgi:cytochrome c oxidase cbb3-type subunit III
MKRPCVAAVAAITVALVACEREARPFRFADRHATVRETPTDLHAGVASYQVPDVSPFQQNAWGLSEGKRLFAAYNCSGCHGNGGGGMGPALMDAKWIYGSHPSNIFSSIVNGRPNGMPSWGGNIPDPQVWQLVAYVQSLSGQSPQTAMPGRSDHMSGATPENNRPAQTPVRTGSP